MTSRWQTEKTAVLETARRTAELGLTAGASGNVSMRLVPHESRDLMAITPSGKAYTEMAEGDILVVDFEVEPVEGELTPSSESLMHSGIYKARPDVGAVIHTHSIFASVAAVTGHEVPAIIDEMVVLIGGTIKVSEYAFPSTGELADNVCAALGERNAAIIRNHGAVGVGRDLAEALDVCALTERVAQVYFYASMLGQVRSLPKDIVEAEKAIFRMRRQS